MSSGIEFPAFVKIEHKKNAAAETAFMADIDRLLGSAEGRFKAYSAEVGQIIDKSMASFKQGSIGLDFNSSGLRQAAADAELSSQKLKLLEQAARSVVDDMRALGAEFGDVSAASIKFTQAISAQRIEAEAAARESRAQVQAYDLLTQRATRLAQQNDALADSYRAIYLEQAKSENLAFRSQQAINFRAAPGLLNQAIDNGAGYSALAELARQQDAAEDAALAFQKLREAEEAAARGSDLISATYRKTALEVGYAGKSARESASAFDLLFQAADARTAKIVQDFFNTALGIDQATKSARESARVFEEMFAAQDRAAQSQSEMAAAVARLRSELDPTIAIQQRFDAELARADQLLEAGAISQREYAQAVDMARANLQESWRTLTANNEQQVVAAKRGTEANHMMVNSVRAQRTAFIQAGQQMQDMAIQFQMGTRASTIMAQQLPQLGFAFSGLDGNANKSLATLGKFGTFIAGPWGAAITIALVALGPLIDKLFDFGETADESTKKAFDLSRGIDVLALSAKDGASAMAQLESATKSAIKAQGDFLAVQAQTASKAVSDLEGRIAIAQKELDQIKAENQRTGFFGTGVGGVSLINSGRKSELENQLALDRQALANAKVASTNAELALSQRKVMDGLDASTAATNRYAEAIGKLELQRRKSIEDPVGAAASGSYISKEQYEAQFRALTVERDGALAAAREANKTARQVSQFLAEFSSPLSGYSLTGKFGEQRKGHKHAGIDMAAALGTPIYAPQSGIVDYASAAGAYGNLIKLNHGAGTETRYGHLSKFAVQQGQAVEKGDVLGYVGSTGRSTGPHLHYEVRVNGKLVDPSKGKFPIDDVKVAEAAEKARQAMQDFGDRASESIKRISERFDEQPRLIDAANAATRELDATIKDLSERKPVGWEQLVADAERAKGAVQEALVRPYEELRQESERRLEIESLLTAGREDEARALQTIWQLEDRIGEVTQERKDEILEIVRRERMVTEELQRRQEMVSNYLDMTRSVKSELTSLFAGEGNLANLGRAWRNLNAQVMVEKIFGPMFRDLDKWVKEQSGVTTSVDHFTTETERAAKAAGSVADSLLSTASRLAGGGAPVASDAAFLASFDATFAKPGAANDNGLPEEIVVVAKKGDEGSLLTLTPQAYFEQLTRRMTVPMTEALAALGVKLGSGGGALLSGALGGYMVGGTPGAILGGLSSIKGLGGQNGVFGKALGGIMEVGAYGPLLDQVFGMHTQSTGGQIGAGIGALIPGIGPLAGSLFGGLLGNGSTGSKIGAGLGGIAGYLAAPAVATLLSGGVTASLAGAVTAGFSGGGGGALLGIGAGPIGLVVGALLGSLLGGVFHKAKYANASFSGGALNVNTNSSGLRDGAQTVGGDLMSNLTSIADALGAQLGAFNVSLGQTDGKWRISTTGRSGELKSKYPDVKVFGEGDAAYQAALQAAIADAISDGAITGISQAAQNILKAGGDLQKAIEKAALIQSIPKMLKQMTDPVGYALDELNAEFKKMVDALKEGGASAEEFADAQKLYDLKRAEAIKQASEQMTGSLRSLYDQLTIGNDALSLRDRRAMAFAAYTPLAGRVAAGDSSAYNDFADAARTLLDIERQLNGSQGDFFSLQDAVRELTKGELDRQQALIDAATASSSPFSTAPESNGAQNVVDAIGVGNDLLGAINDNLRTIGIAIGSGQIAGTQYRYEAASNF